MSFVVPSSLPAPRPKVQQVVENGEPLVIEHSAADSNGVTDVTIVRDIVETMLNRIETADASDNESANVPSDKIVVDAVRMTGKVGDFCQTHDGTINISAGEGRHEAKRWKRTAHRAKEASKDDSSCGEGFSGKS